MRRILNSGLVSAIVGLTVMSAAAWPASALEIQVDIQAAALPTSVRLHREGGGPPIVLGPGSYAGSFIVGVDPPRDAWQSTYTLVATWPNNKKLEIYVRTTSISQEPIWIAIFDDNFAANADTIAFLRAQGGSLEALFQQYFGAKRIYRSLQAGAIRNQALRLWFDAAYALAKDYSYIAPDREVIALVQAAEDNTYYLPIIPQFQSLNWRDVDLARAYTESRNFQLAAFVNSYYLNAYQTASPSDRQAANIQGVYLDRLTENANALAWVNTIAVTTVKLNLSCIGLYSGPLDNFPDDNFRRSVSEFQRREGLAVDGIVGATTGAAIQAIAC